jgi:hypothetical protein
MNDNEIGNAMRRLPRVTASPRFTSDVLRAVRSRHASRVAWRFAAVTAMVLMIIAGTYAAALRQRQERLQSLRAERQRIEMELHRVKAIADHSQPVVVLENGDTRLIVNRENPKQRPQLFYY